MFSKASKQFTSFHKYINTSAAAGIAYQKYKQSKQLPDIKPERFQAVTFFFFFFLTNYTATLFMGCQHMSKIMATNKRILHVHICIVHKLVIDGVFGQIQ